MSTDMRVFVLVAAVFLAAGGAAGQEPTFEQVKAKIAQLDRELFDAYNRCDLDRFRTFFIDGDIEFYHDQGGLSTSLDDLVEALKKNICGKIRRRLEPGSMEIYPVPGYGVIEVGAHRFYQVSKDGGPETGGTKLVRFLHIWKYAGGEWKVTRVVSYAH